MATLPTQRQEFQAHEFILASHEIPSSSDDFAAVKEAQKKLNRLSSCAQRAPSAKCVLYRAAHQGLPELSEVPEVANGRDFVEENKPAPDRLDIDLDRPNGEEPCPVVPQEVPDDDSDADPVDFTAYDELDAEYPEDKDKTENPLPLTHLETWARILRAARRSEPPSMAASCLSGADYSAHDSLDGTQSPGTFCFSHDF